MIQNQYDAALKKVIRVYIEATVVMSLVKNHNNQKDCGLKVITLKV